MSHPSIWSGRLQLLLRSPRQQVGWLILVQAGGCPPYGPLCHRCDRTVACDNAQSHASAATTGIGGVVVAGSVADRRVISGHRPTVGWAVVPAMFLRVRWNPAQKLVSVR